MRELIERRSGRVVELERNDGYGAVANGSYAGVSLDARYKFPLVEPEIAVAARIPTSL
jgi:hypothetical protein